MLLRTMYCDTKRLIVRVGLPRLCRLDNAKNLSQNSDVAGTSGGVNQKQIRGKPGVSSYFERQELALTRSHWQVI